jgi:hypothetical protein
MGETSDVHKNLVGNSQGKREDNYLSGYWKQKICCADVKSNELAQGTVHISDFHEQGDEPSGSIIGRNILIILVSIKH